MTERFHFASANEEFCIEHVTNETFLRHLLSQNGLLPTGKYGQDDLMQSFSRFLRRYMFLLFSSLMFASLNHGFGADAHRWEKAIKAFEDLDEQNPPPSKGVLFIGSSSIRQWKTLVDDFPEQTVINRGFGGSTIPDSIYFFDRIVKPYQPSTIVFYAGDNDVAKGHDAEQVYTNFKTFADLVKHHLPETKLVFISIKPSLSRWHLAPEMEKANKKIRTYAKFHRRVAYADVWNPMLGEDGKPKAVLFVRDGLHMNKNGYEIWRQVIGDKL